ncbi:MAG: hypothetical protein R2838_00980 [Caldilineaceae bacterium]
MLTVEQLAALSNLLAGLDTPRRQDVVTAVLNNPALRRMCWTTTCAVLLTAPDIPAALAFIRTPADPASYAADLLSVGPGRRTAAPLRGQVRLAGGRHDGGSAAAVAHQPGLHAGECDGAALRGRETPLAAAESCEVGTPDGTQDTVD